ncbi:hypothetical protein LS73_004985 [Helicobacter muridarum]|nr:hypothetical protein [Helicobacter muridarum]TLE00341.1 hypothetical protein LS73_004985 [Helicobacter muridarum]
MYLGNKTRYGYISHISLSKENTIAAHKNLCQSLQIKYPINSSNLQSFIDSDLLYFTFYIKDKDFTLNKSFDSSTIPIETINYYNQYLNSHCKKDTNKKDNTIDNGIKNKDNYKTTPNNKNEPNNLYQKILEWSYSIQNISKDSEVKAIYNNEDIKIYIYGFRFNSDEKIFRPNDIFQVIPDYSNMPNFIYAIHGYKHSRFGDFASFKKLETNSIEITNIAYKLTLKPKFIIHTLTALFLIGIIVAMLTFGIESIKQKFLAIIPLKLKIPNTNGICPNRQKELLSVVLSNFVFTIYCIFIALIIISQSMLISIDGDDWVYANSDGVFYQPYQIFGEFWSRGRHFVDILVSLCMLPLGRVFISFGFSPLETQEFFSAFFSLVFYFLLFTTLSILVWILNKKQHFKMIFVICSLGCIYCCSHVANYNTVAAYIGTAGFSLLFFLPIAYYFLHNIEYSLILKNPIGYCILFFYAYSACFVTETSSLAIFGLSVFILVYYCIKQEESIEISIFIRIMLILFLVPISFILTILSGRGAVQIEGLHQTRILDSILHGFSSQPILCKYIIIISIFYLGFLFVKMILSNIDKQEYFTIALLCTGLLGVIGFSAINVKYIFFEVILLFCALLFMLLRFNNHSNAIIRWLSSFVVISLIVCLSIQTIRGYHLHFLQYANKNAHRNLIAIFQNAEKEGLSKITLSKDEAIANGIDLLLLEDNQEKLYNQAITQWIYKYGYTKKPIGIEILK